jgi:hypothetical protein
MQTASVLENIVGEGIRRKDSNAMSKASFYFFLPK